MKYNWYSGLVYCESPLVTSAQVSFVIKFQFLLLSVNINWLSVITRIKFQFQTFEHNLPEQNASERSARPDLASFSQLLCVGAEQSEPDKYFPQWKGGEQPHCRQLEIERKYFQTQTNYLHRTAVILAGEAGGFSVSVWSPADCALQTVVSRYIFNYQVLASHTTLFSDHIFFPSLFSLLNFVISKHRQLKEF